MKFCKPKPGPGTPLRKPAAARCRAKIVGVLWTAPIQVGLILAKRAL